MMFKQIVQNEKQSYEVREWVLFGVRWLGKESDGTYYWWSNSFRDRSWKFATLSDAKQALQLTPRDRVVWPRRQGL